MLDNNIFDVDNIENYVTGENTVLVNLVTFLAIVSTFFVPLKSSYNSDNFCCFLINFCEFEDYLLILHFFVNFTIFLMNLRIYANFVAFS